MQIERAARVAGAGLCMCTLYDKKVNSFNNSNLQIDISTFAKGIYFLKVAGKDDVIYKKLIIE